MRTGIDKHVPKPWEHIINEDGMAWTVKVTEEYKEYEGEYSALIPDARLDHCDFEGFGYHRVKAQTIEELIADIKAIGVPYYSENGFLKTLLKIDAENKVDDRQVELYFDSRGTKVTRGTYNINNMTAYTSL